MVNRRKAALAAGALAAASGAANAAVGDAIFTQLTTDATGYITAGTALVVLVLGFTVGVKLVKKIISKST